VTSPEEKANPWLGIPASDYEGHMSSGLVGQLPVLNRIVKSVLEEYRPGSLLVLGCATGNGFEHVDPRITKNVTGVDINQEYLDILRHRYADESYELKLVCSDLSACSFEPASFDHVHGALIFEYVNPESILPKIKKWLKPEGVLSVVLQLPSPESAEVTETSYQSLTALESSMRVVDPDVFAEKAAACDFDKIGSFQRDLQLGKKFNISFYRNSSKR
jgi:ubiquinone/menaquinone biosynthesis C-methylase UbiE